MHETFPNHTFILFPLLQFQLCYGVDEDGEMFTIKKTVD